MGEKIKEGRKLSKTIDTQRAIKILGCKQVFQAGTLTPLCRTAYMSKSSPLEIQLSSLESAQTWSQRISHNKQAYFTLQIVFKLDLESFSDKSFTCREINNCNHKKSDTLSPPHNVKPKDFYAFQFSMVIFYGPWYVSANIGEPPIV